MIQVLKKEHGKMKYGIVEGIIKKKEAFGDLLGIPNPASYYTLELLPFLAEELEGWERRMQGRKGILAEKAGQYDFCC